MKRVHPQDLWIYDKYILSRKLGYRCGLGGEDVLERGRYIVRPCLNLLGMGAGARFEDIEKVTDEVVPPGYFWCEVFRGSHLSADYIDGWCHMVAEGFKGSRQDTSRWGVWIKRNKKIEIEIPQILELAKKYRYMNIEYIGGRIIEIHLRLNPDFAGHGSNYAIPVWAGDEVSPMPDEIFMESPDAGRLGFLIRKPLGA